jgi:hypothetical protein
MTNNGIKARRAARDANVAKRATKMPDARPIKVTKKRTTTAEWQMKVCASSEGLTKLHQVHTAESELKLDYVAVTDGDASETFVSEIHRRIISRPHAVTGMGIEVAVAVAKVSPEDAWVSYSSADPLGKLMTKGRSCALTRKFAVLVPAEDDPAGYRIAIGVAVITISYDKNAPLSPSITGLQSGHAMVSRVDVPQFDWKVDPSHDEILSYVQVWMNMAASVRMKVAAAARASKPDGWSQSFRSRMMMSWVIDQQTPLSFIVRGDGDGAAIANGARRDAEALVKPNKKSPNRRSRDEIVHMIGYELRKINSINPPFVER